MKEQLAARPVRRRAPSWALPAALVAAHVIVLAIVVPRLGPDEGDGDRIKGL